MNARTRAMYGIVGDTYDLFSVHFPLIICGDQRRRKGYGAYRQQIRKKSYQMLRDLARAIKLNRELRASTKCTLPQTEFHFVKNNDVARTFPYEDVVVTNYAPRYNTVDDALCNLYGEDNEGDDWDCVGDEEYSQVIHDYTKHRREDYRREDYNPRAYEETFNDDLFDLDDNAAVAGRASHKFVDHTTPRAVKTEKRIPKEYFANEDIFQELSNISMSLNAANDANRILLDIWRK